MRKKQFEKFDVHTIPLEGRNLVEASAGTGKTFSIGLLVLRLILEKSIPLEKILLVTFTNNAVAELEERIRLFIRNSHNYAENNIAADDSIKKIVDHSIASTSKETVVQQLKDAQLFLDQLSVMTIHGFCQRTLSNLAFETGQLFGSELIKTMDEIYAFYANEFWRNHINTLPANVFKRLKDVNFSPESVSSLIKDFYAGKIFFKYLKGSHARPDGKEFSTMLTNREKRQTDIRHSFDDYLSQHAGEIKTLMENNAHAKKYAGNLQSSDKMWNYLVPDKKGTPSYKNKVFGTNLLPYIEACMKIEEEIEVNTDQFLNEIYCYAIDAIAPKVDHHIRAAGQISFDGLIKNLNIALSGDRSQLIAHELQSEYKAVFVDEFQDTDKLQYEIFKSAFHENTILFYIGDPKQSIYAFRQADINTYLAAYNDVNKLYSMNINYRSTSAMVSALNRFFLPSENFDTFCFEGQPNPIRYLNVTANPKSELKDFCYDEREYTPLNIEICKNDAGIKAGLVNKILNLLTDKRYKIGTRNLRPSDIGILVKSNKFGKEIKDLLSQKNVPAVILNDDKIMKSPEAIDLYHVLRAMHNPTIENIHTGLLNSFTGKKSSEIITLKGDQLVGLFRNYKALWEAKGINQALSAWIKDFGVRKYLVRPDTVNGLRIVSNLEQLKELLIKTEYTQRLNPDELLDWMKRAKDLELLSEDESVIRLENDADSITITTIHRAKGLQYNIVFSPQSDLTFKDAAGLDFVNLYRDGRYILIPGRQMNEYDLSDYETQSFRESRRLLYVTLTRAVFCCFAYTKTTPATAKKSAFAPFLNEVQPNELIGITKQEENTQEDTPIRYIPEGNRNAIPASMQTSFIIKDASWQFMSYSGLTPEHGYTSPQMTNREYSEYDDFVFEKLRRGNITGTMLHEILERTDFQNPDRNTHGVNNAIGRYAASNSKVYQQYLPEMICHILNARINADEQTFQLKDIAYEKRLQELEFDFPAKSFNTFGLIKMCGSAGYNISILGRTDLYGMMNGFIDLFFEHKGKYYVLDWKSNYLGNNIDDYTGKDLNDSMTSNNYHLQYLIYTLAICKYLKQRLKSFDYEKHFGGIIYCFVRGMREEKENGVFFVRPEMKFVEQIGAFLTKEVNNNL